MAVNEAKHYNIEYNIRSILIDGESVTSHRL